MGFNHEVKRWLPILLAGLFLLIIGCEKERAREKQEKEAVVPSVEKEGPHLPDLSPWSRSKIDWRQCEGASLSVLAAAHAGFPTLKPLLPSFEALTGIRVGYLMVEETDMRTQRRMDLSSRGGVYDVVSIGVTYLGEAHAGGWLEDLSSYMNDPSLTDPAWFNFEDIGPSFRDLLVKEKQLLAIPYSSASPVFWYRKDLFLKYGISVPDSFSEIIPMKEKLQAALERDGLTDIYAFATRAKIGAGRNTWIVIPCIRAHGGEMLDENFRAIFNAPEAVKALSVYRKMITGRGTPPESEAMGFYKMRELFRRGKLASLIVASDFFNDIDTPEKSPVWDKWDAEITPRGPVSRETSPWAWGWGINSASRQHQRGHGEDAWHRDLPCPSVHVEHQSV